jgi:excisionase family DNA binding protein
MGEATAFTVSQAAEVLGVSRQAVHYLCKRGRLKWWLYGSRMMISRRSVYSYRDLRETLIAAKARQEAEARAKVEERERRRGKAKEDGRRWRK